MQELTAFEREVERQEYARREDITTEREFWRDVLFSTFTEGEKITDSGLEKGMVVADKALAEFRIRFQ